MHGKSQTQHTRQTAEEGVTSCSGKRQTEREDERQTETGLRNEEQVRRDAGGSEPPDRGTCKRKYTETYKWDSYFGTGRRSLILTALLLYSWISESVLWCHRKQEKGSRMLTDRWWSFFLRWTKGAFWFRKMQLRLSVSLSCVKRAGEDRFFLDWTSAERSDNRKLNSPGTEQMEK